MYSIDVALRRFKSLIRWTAWRFSRNRRLHLSFEDVESEGFLTLVRCCREFPEGEVHFARYFKRTWYNHLKILHRNQMFQKRQGVEVDIEKAESRSVENEQEEFLERMKSRYQEVSPLLSDDARRLLETLLDPPLIVAEVAYRDFCRRNRLYVQGQPVTGYKSFRIRQRHIQQVLGMSSSRIKDVVEEVQTASRKITQLRRK